LMYTLHYFMGRRITISPSSVERLTQHFPKSTARADKSMVSRLLNRQIKAAMHSLLREVTRNVLEDLGRDLKTRSKTVWSPCFCVIAILCICIEEVQIATNSFVTCPLAHGTRTAQPSSQATIDICRKLDNIPFVHLMDLFHGLYKTYKPLTIQRNDHVYNPIRDGLEIDSSEGIGQDSVNLVNDLHKVVEDHGKYIPSAS
jgi:hypothetical protein